MKRCLFRFLFCIAILMTASCALHSVVSPVANFVQCKSVEKPTDSIINGEEVGLGDVDQKLVTRLFIQKKDRSSVCTGTLLSDHVVLTAAHCVRGVQPSDVMANFVTEEGCPGGKMREVETPVNKVIIHADFDGTPQSMSDLALLYLKEAAPETQRRVSLLKNISDLKNPRILLLGYGITDETKNDSQTLRRVYKNLKQDFEVRERVVLVDQSRKTGGFCRGDSGAPLLAELWGEPRIFGVNSANIGMKSQTECQTMSLVINTVYFRDWISQNQKKLENLSWWKQITTDDVQEVR